MRIYSHFQNYLWKYLSRNSKAVYLLERNPEHINWKHLSSNENAIHLLEEHPDKLRNASDGKEEKYKE